MERGDIEFSGVKPLVLYTVTRLLVIYGSCERGSREGELFALRATKKTLDEVDEMNWCV